ncbi:MAG TPA: hypothetical protein VEO54_29975 [Thermoanaerobaculia bacterium]|nr:hypothetical protein [Thermoanaerobaculia bacterium]
MRQTVFPLLLLALLFPVQASALQTEDLVAIAAMPLAVAAVSEITDVPTADLLSLIATMNRAQVPAPQFIEVVRYAPVALVDTSEPFVPYITSQVNEGVTGQELAVVMEDRIERYEGAETIDVVSAPRVVVVDQHFLPEVVVTRFQPVRYDPLALVAMPLAVAAVAELADVPPLELASMVSLLNQANVPPAQFVEIVRYSPVALVDDDPAFLTYVTTQVGDGTRGIELARRIEDRYEVLGLRDIEVVRPSVSEVFVAPVAVAHRPPGQVKKQLGLQTGAEVVHGVHPGRGKATRVAKAERKSRGSDRVVASRSKPRKVERVSRPRVERAPKVDRAPRVKQRDVAVSRGNGGGGKPARGNSGGGKGNSGGGKGNGKGKGKG